MKTKVIEIPERCFDSRRDYIDRRCPFLSMDTYDDFCHLYLQSFQSQEAKLTCCKAVSVKLEIKEREDK